MSRVDGSRRTSGLGLLVAVSLLTLPGEARAQAPGSISEEPLVVNFLFRDAEWGPPGRTPRFPAGVQTAQLGVDPESGGPTYLARFPSGSHFDLHWHTHPEYVVVMSGAVTLVLGDETHSLRQGAYVVIPGGMQHSWDVPEGEAVVILVRRGGPADFNFVEP
jgi:mannose-6-phosphate isomerase-like protein (cupin superfamily)